MYIICKMDNQQSNGNLRSHKCLLYNKQPVENATLPFSVFSFSSIKKTFAKKFNEKAVFFNTVTRYYKPDIRKFSQSSIVTQNFIIWQPLTVKGRSFEYFSKSSRKLVFFTQYCKLKKYVPLIFPTCIICAIDY